MKKWQIIGLVIVALALIALIWVFWGSLFSILLAMCLIQDRKSVV